jgi:hypothetical protein
MDEQEFWRIIESSRDEADGDPEEQMDALARILSKLPEKAIVEFDRMFGEYWVAAYTWPLWGAAYLVGGGCSDDGFMDFRGWLISRGRAAYERALANPDSLADVLTEGEDGQIEGFHYVASRAWEQATGKDSSDFPDSGVRHPDEPTGQPWEEEDLPESFPRLARIVG